MEKDNKLGFKISSALKSIIGKDLINDKYIAVFELVKNSYDAYANNVNILFDNGDNVLKNKKIVISDDGSGMDYEDLKNKWLFVAYSEKKNKSNKNKSERISAGAKGVGRFSCDRLGSKLKIITKREYEEMYNVLEINWDDFEKDDTNNFIDIKIDYKYVMIENGFRQGTYVEICDLREDWSFDDLRKLKTSLKRLINPSINNDKNNTFAINLECISENYNSEFKEFKNEFDGYIKNDVFEMMTYKTILIDVKISEDGKKLETELNDRGSLVYRLVQINPYPLLKNIHFSLMYLNRSAKTNFTRNMGLEPKNYGSVFVYKNGFRIYPYGEPGIDFCSIDLRKAQGYNRYLGTRDVMGMIEILGDNPLLYETSSRNGGFVENKTFDSFVECFKVSVHRILEKYVVDIVAWADININKGIFQPLEIKDIFNKVIDEFSSINKKSEIIELKYGDELLKIIDEKKVDGINHSLEKIKKEALKQKNDVLINMIADVSGKIDKLQQKEKQSRDTIDKLNKQIVNQETYIRSQEQQNYFLTKIVSKNSENLLSALHLINIYTDSSRKFLNRVKDSFKDKMSVNEYNLFLNMCIDINKAYKLTDFAIYGGDFYYDTNQKSGEITSFVSQYIDYSKYEKIKFEIKNKIENKKCYFDSAGLGLIIDNLVSNSIKFKAKNVIIEFEENNEYIIMHFNDDGIGLKNDEINSEKIFLLGYSTTNGSGIGLYHTKEMMKNMKGDIKINSNYKNGFGLILSFKK